MMTHTLPSEQTRLVPGSDSSSRPKKRRISKRSKIIVSTVVCIGLLLVLVQLAFPSSFALRSASHKKKNVIFFVTDGMGPASLSMARSFNQHVNDLPIDDILTLDEHFIGSSRTRSSDSLVTDSAAGATAFACALKSYNGAIGVDPHHRPCGTVLEAAKLAGYLTGLVVTTRITDATPASFSSHVDYRWQEDLIATHQLGEYPLGRVVDLLMGGGRSHFYPQGEKASPYGHHGARKDGRDLIDEAQSNGWQYVGDRKNFDSLLKSHGENVTLPFLGLFADNDIPFEIDRDEKEYPSLKEQVKVALGALEKASNEDKDSNGFFLMVEGSRIDHAGHQNDPASQVREVLAFDEAFQYVLEFAENSDTETVLVSTSDHETGGLVTSRQVTASYPQYVWYPQVLANATHSGEFLKRKLVDFVHEHKGASSKIENFIKHEILEKDLGIYDYTDSDLETLIHLDDNANAIQDKLNDMVSFRAQIGWTTHGHSAVDVNIYAYANKKATWSYVLNNLQGNHENTEVGQFLENFLELNLSEVTDLIRDTKHTSDFDATEIASEVQHYDEYYHELAN
ncbi:BFH_collapsed_G0013090.mRNA.1.CDS.1 [Saccharomyces cerevisiae]|nr:BFH_HP2_G0012720.mRNA.1.CDS.1 [Saccharomyces cerevisiae]CAI6447567.1 BFH_HP2_G0012720.mRNA.1.CDS.1 [Saccharomyces cerevisiae]CAI6451674.1 BFH_HP1_G0012950.mRNA.1.CDS.1 [Saccharomyces cerevisiae]CAI7085165.1 BFH_collapsed_G0013090.mRNA.1.CDS.1 [Saccharomyces cerevisiae]